VRFVLRKSNAEDMLAEVQAINEKIRFEIIVPVSVKLLPALRGIAAGTNPYDADSFDVHSVQEVFEYLRQSKV